MNALDLLMATVAMSALGTCLLVLVLRRNSGGSMPSDSLLRSIGDLASLKSQVDALTSQQGGLAQTLGTLHSAVQGVETRVIQSTAGVQETIGRQVQEARVAVERLKADAEASKRMEDEIQASSRRIETVLLGSRSRGAAGENILHDAFRQFPPEMVETNFRVNGKVVEYALVLANSKRLPIDSKWPSPDLLQGLGQDGSDPADEATVTAEIERVLRGKLREVRQYIDPAVTLPWAIAALPDAVFNACRKAHLDAYRENIILMPYSMTIPYVLALFRLHLQYARSIDIENLEGYLQHIEDNVNGLERSLENSISRGSTMIQNAFNDCKRNVGQMRGALAALRAMPQVSVESARPRLLPPVEQEAAVGP